MRGALVLLTSTLITLTLQAQGRGGLNPEHPLGKTLRIELIGDSTQTDKAGYGRGFCANLVAEVDCVNMARAGTSTKTFRELGIWDRAIASRPDYMLIQFGHNDMVTPAHMQREVPLPQYKENLKGFVRNARAVGTKPILVTPLARRYFGADGKVHDDLTAYAAAMEQVAVEMKVPLIDLHRESIAYLDKIGEQKALTLSIIKKDAQGNEVVDKTHLNWAGSYVFGRIVAEGMRKTVPALGRYVRAMPAKLPPAGVKAMKICEGAPVKIVLVGDSTVATGGGWGPGFCAAMTPNVTCINDAQDGKSSSTYYTEGFWRKALKDHGDYYLIQFGYNDMRGGAAQRDHPDTTFAADIKRYIRQTRAIGATPVVVTPLASRTYKDGRIVQDLKEYAEAAKEIADEEDATVVDLNRMSSDLLGTMTQEQADQFDAKGHMETSGNDKEAALEPARILLNPHGQEVFGHMVAIDLVRNQGQPELGPDVLGKSPAVEKGSPVFHPAQDESTMKH
jgi:lysophospholipase L1-like esterase